MHKIKLNKQVKYLPIAIVLLLFSCTNKKENAALNINENWLKNKVNIQQKDSLQYGKSYLSVYSEIYSMSEHKTHNLTAMISLRNTSDLDSIYLLSAKYYNTKGKLLKNFISHSIFLAPMETVEIIIDENDTTGGTGSNFIFEWKIPQNCPEPLFEGVMNSTIGQQGLSFTTQAKRIK